MSKHCNPAIGIAVQPAPLDTVLDEEFADASRKLIALHAAAPDMLAALHRCIAALAANGAPNCQAVKEARAAIAKAEGG